jgi:flagellar hook-basal body complex protein FliE
MTVLIATNIVTAAGGGTGTSGAASWVPSIGHQQAAEQTPFGNLLSDAVGQVSSLENQARATVDGLMGGSGVDVHQAMIATQKADMAFELALAVRNKAMQAYQSVMGMQF